MGAGVVGGEEDVVESRRAGGVSPLILRLIRGLTPPARLLHGDDQRAFAEGQRLFDGLRQARPHFRLQLQPVDDHLDVVLDAAVELEVVGQAHDLAVHAGAEEAALEHVLEQVLVLALLAAHHRGEDEEARPLRQGEDAGEDLLARLGGDGPAAVGAVALADAGVEDAEIVVDLGDGADGGARVAAGRLLLDADGRRQAAEVIDVRLLELAEELAGVGRQRLDVAPLSLGVERVEGQRAFARAADAGEDDELVARQVEVDVAEVVFAGAADDDGAVIHNGGPPLLMPGVGPFL